MKTALVWFRRDLRLTDNAALAAALNAAQQVHCAFVFDTDILDALEDRADRRVAFIHGGVAELDAALRARGGGLIVLHGPARHLIPELAARLGAQAVYAARDYEPFARERDAQVAQVCDLRLVKDQVIFETDELLTGAGRPYHVFTPYSRAWLGRVGEAGLAAHDCRALADKLAPLPHPNPSPGGRGAFHPSPAGGRAGDEGATLPSLQDLGFATPDLKPPPGETAAQALWTDFQPRLARYKTQRDHPAVKGPSYLSPHLRFGTISIRQLARHAWRQEGEGARTWLSELIWREFYQMLLWHYPATAHHAFQTKFDAIPWPNPPGHFEAWCEARTGYPIVDAAMRQLNQTGYMHNRLRMIAASFLVKDLHVDWRWGERYFAQKLLDYDQAANLGGWQWSAGVGTDAQPWFRIFNPVTQSERFDPEGKFLRRYLPELAGVPDKFIHAPWRAGGVAGYPAPIVDHALVRLATLALFKSQEGA